MTNINKIIVAGGDAPRNNASSQARVLDRLEKALNRDVPKWYVLAFEDQAEAPIFKDLIGARLLEVSLIKEKHFVPNNEPCVVLSILPPERLTDANWSIVKRFSANNCSSDTLLLVAQHIEETVKKISPIWRDNDFTQQGTYVVGKFVFHALLRSI